MGTERDSQAAGEGRHLTDSPAKIAADLEPLARKLESDYPTHRPIARAMRNIAARVEGLGDYRQRGEGLHYCPHCCAPMGLEPGEREEINKEAGEIQFTCERYWAEHNIPEAEMHSILSALHNRAQKIAHIAALTPIAERK